jgi:ATP-binding cassette, subfamily B, multidrug efflux pump
MSKGANTSNVDASADGTMSDRVLIKRLFTYLWAHRLLLFLTLSLYPLMALSVALPPMWVREILDHVIPERNLDALWLYGGLYFGALILEYGTGVVAQFTMSVLGQRAMRKLRHELFDKVLHLPASFFDRYPVGRTLTRLTNDVDALGEMFTSGAISIVGDLITLSFLIVSMLLLDARLTLLAFLVVPPMVAISFVFRIYARRAFRLIRYHLSQINVFLAEHISAMGVVQSFNQQERTCLEFAVLNRDYRDKNRSAILLDAMLFAIVEAIGTTATAAVLWFGSQDFTKGVLGAGTLIAFAHYIRRFFVPLRDLSTKYTILQSAFAAAERIFTLYDEPILIQSPKSPIVLSKLQDALGFDEVWFRYPKTVPNPDDEGPKVNPWILKGFNLRIKHGESVALVGHTGCGKSTLLKLLNRSYDVNRGRVWLDGDDIRDHNLEHLRKLFTIVMQDIYLFKGSVRDNLLLGADVSEEDMVDAARAVQAHRFIEQLPRGYDTQVEPLGSNFSVGERQLLAFARAMLSNAPILMLDEATSHVDSATETCIQEAMDVLLESRTSVVVAHRLSTIQKADRIIVLSQGQIVEEGNHTALMTHNGAYRQLVDLHHHDVLGAGR